MTITSIAAWWGAGVSTVVFLWDIVKWFNRGAKLRVDITPNVTYSDAEVISTGTDEHGQKYKQMATYFHIEIVNIGAQPTTILDIKATHEITPSFIGQCTTSSICFRFHNGASLPHKLGPGESVGVRLDKRLVEQAMELGPPFLILKSAHKEKPYKFRFPV